MQLPIDFDDEIQTPDTKPGPYYVTCRDGGRTAFLVGPFERHVDALDLVEPARKRACEIDPRAHFYAFGTCRLHDPAGAPQGRLNADFGLPSAPLPSKVPE